VFGRASSNGRGVVGIATNATAVEGSSTDGAGLWGISEAGEGVHGETNSTFFAAVAGISRNANRDRSGGASAGVFGKSEAGEGVHGESNSTDFAAVAGIQLKEDSKGAGIYGEHRGNGPAGFFKGNVVVTGDVILTNADCSEDFDIVDLDK